VQTTQRQKPRPNSAPLQVTNTIISNIGEEAAKRRGLSMNAEIVWRLERSFEQREMVDIATMSRVVTDLISELNALQSKVLDNAMLVAGDVSSVQKRALITLDLLYPRVDLAPQEQDQ
jgi:ribosomal protein L18E